MSGEVGCTDNALAGYLDDRRDHLIDFLRKLVQTKTVNPPGSEEALAEVVAEELRGFGIPSILVGHGDGRASVVGVLKGAGKRGALMFNGHADTVPVGEAPWERDPFGGEVVDGRLHGRGASDMKSGVAAMIFAAAALAQCGIELQGDLVVAITAGEEVDSVGARAVAASEWARGVDKILIAEPSSLDVYVAEKGALWLRLAARGKIAHGSMPEHGINAVEHLMAALGGLRETWAGRLSGAHPLLGRATVSVNTIRGGIKTNVVPDFAEATVDIRTLPRHDHSSLVEEVRARLEGFGENVPGLRIECEALNDRAAYEIAPDHRLIKELVDVIRDVRGRDPGIAGVAFYTDASVFWPSLKVPIVICGPGDASLAHQPNEFVEIPRVIDGAKIYAEWARRLLT